MKVILFAALFLLLACGSKQSQPEDMAKSDFITEINRVDTVILKQQTFIHEIITNGKLRAIRKSNLGFPVGGLISEIHSPNGLSVRQGDMIACLDKSEIELKLRQADHTLRKAYVELLDYIVGFGYQPDTMAIPKEFLQTAYIRSGYFTAVDQIELLRYELKNMDIRAPFPGTVANMDHKVHQSISPSEVFCTLIDDSRFEVEFSLLESELSLVRTGQLIKVYPFHERETQFQGRITEINPFIDERGQIKVRAEIHNLRRGVLIEGMNVQIVLESVIPDQLVVPKSAIVLRDNQEVLFRYENGTAKWTYVNILHSNANYHAIVPNTSRGARLTVGDAIIVEGNLNLGNEVAVKLQ